MPDRKHCARCSRPVGIVQKGICRPYTYEVIDSEEVPVCMDPTSCKISESMKVQS